MSEDLLARLAGQAFLLGTVPALVLLLAEGWWPVGTQRIALGRRWVANLLAYAATAVLLRWLPLISLLATALLAKQNGWGLFNRLHAPELVAVAFSVLAIDLSGYLVHRLEHRIPLLWRIHRMHHSDPDVDVTTTYRFHPFEVLLRAGANIVVACAVGMPPVAAAGYLLVSTITSVLSHANLRLPRVLDRTLGLIVITPGIHRTHHSVDRDDSNSNFSVCLSCWDRLFGTFRPKPTLGYAHIEFGVEGRTGDDATSILRMLADPFLPEHARA